MPITASLTFFAGNASAQLLCPTPNSPRDATGELWHLIVSCSTQLLCQTPNSQHGATGELGHLIVFWRTQLLCKTPNSPRGATGELWHLIVSCAVNPAKCHSQNMVSKSDTKSKKHSKIRSLSSNTLLRSFFLVTCSKFFRRVVAHITVKNL